MDGSRIARVEWGMLEGKRPRVAGCNARLPAHGDRVRVPLLRLTTQDGASGFGVCHAGREKAEALLGQPFDTLWNAQAGAAESWRAFDYPLWDLAGQRAGKPVYALAAALNDKTPPDTLRAPCYDTSLYFDDLHLDSENEAAALLAAEAQEGWQRGHRAFKIKVGRGARHLDLEAGTRRDIAIIRAIRETVGPDAPLMIDANNGYNLNLARRVLAETADCHLFWLEEAFHEDEVLYRELKGWLAEQNLSVLIADGEGQASPSLLDWAQKGLVEVIQYDIFGYGFTRWLLLGRQLDAWGVRSAPHHYGGHVGNYTSCHLAAAIDRFTFVEWDEATTPGLDGSAYILQDGQVEVPNTPGFGLSLDEDTFRHAVEAQGYTLTAH